MKDFGVLRFLDIFKGIFEKIGVDYPAMRKILNVKLILDGRRVSTVLSNQNNKKKEKESKDKNNFLKSLWTYILMGAFLILFIVIGDNFLFQMSFVFGITMFLLMTSLIADFSSVLLDIKDKEILLSKPIDSKTLNMAKILHIFMYITAITMAISGPSLIVSIKRHGFTFFFIYLLAVILIALFTIILTALIYLVVLRFSSGEKLKDIINYVQIGLTIVMSLGYQLIGRLFDFIDINNLEYNPSLWKYFFPPLWFAAPFELILKGNNESYIVIYSILGVVIPIVSIVIYIKLMPMFERNLQKLNSAEGQTKDKNKVNIFVSKLACKDEEERTFYKFAANMLKNERTFKLKVYPSLGMAIIFPFLMMFSMNRSQFSNISNTKNYLWIYMAFVMIPNILILLGYSGNYKGAWIYETIPIKNKPAIYRGTVKAAIVNLFAPVFVLVSLIFLIIYKMQIVDQMIVVGINMLLFTIIEFKILDKNLPFSRAFEVTEGPGGYNILISIFIMGMFILGHYILTRIPYGVYAYIPVGLIISKVAWKKCVA
ncbi:hypothetical protein RBU61_18680 [Tissierella sp. MB52-C2]|uniref:hypothetical protein n=1 Tax=Tissierella sp. MB52-C2 TaxID=3070999 RepID=UPI00280C3B8C|nr:hypothetical protein [Tissierella sp. MB52-C2]WMM24929.1 hypothetical protein RBU61_18680 [Tissierella sp. MB52-C2]